MRFIKLYSLLTENHNMEDFHKKLQDEVQQRVDASKKSDYSRGDRLFTATGGSVVFISDGLTKRDGTRTAFVRQGDHSFSMPLDRLFPAPPTRPQILHNLAAIYRGYKGKDGDKLTDFFEKATSDKFGFSYDEALDAWNATI